MQPEEESPLIQKQQPNQKRVLLVVGMMGSGKSSFIRSLMTNKGSKKPLKGSNVPLISSGLNSCTLEPKLYEVDHSHDLAGDGQPIYVLDTQGLNSNIAATLIQQEIDMFILRENLKIVGIAYVMSKGRQQGKQGSSFLQNFLSNLKLKKNYKDNLFFCIHTDWLHQIKHQVDKERQKSLKQFLEKMKLPASIFKKTVYWESGPQKQYPYKELMKQIEKFGQIDEQEDEQSKNIAKLCNSAYKNQWIKLTQNLKSQIKNACSVQRYFYDYYEFWRKFKNQVSQKGMSQQYSWEKKIFAFQIFVNTRADVKKQTTKHKIGIFASSGLVVQGIALGVMGVAEGVAVYGGVVALSTVAFPVLAVTAGVGAFAFGVYSLVKTSSAYDQSRKKEVYISKESSQIDNIMQQKLQQRIGLLQKQIICEQLLDSDTLVIVPSQMELKLLKKLSKIEKIEVFQEFKQEKKFIGELKVESPVKLIQTDEKSIKLYFHVMAFTLKFASFNQIYTDALQRFYGK